MQQRLAAEMLDDHDRPRQLPLRATYRGFRQVFGANAEGELFVDVFARKRPSPASLIFTEASLIRIPFSLV